MNYIHEEMIKLGADGVIFHSIDAFGKDVLKYGFEEYTLETIENALNLGMKCNTRLICVESVAYQSSLLFWFNYICEQKGITGFTFMPVSPRNQAKNLRIKRGALKLINGEMYLHPAVRSLYVDQISRWDPSTDKNVDDIIDPLGYVDEVIQLYAPYISRLIIPSDESTEAAHSDTIQTLF